MGNPRGPWPDHGEAGGRGRRDPVPDYPRRAATRTRHPAGPEPDHPRYPTVGDPHGRSSPAPSYVRPRGEGEHDLPPVPVTVLHGRWGDGRDLMPDAGGESPVWPGDPFWRRDRDETEPGAVRRAAGGFGSWFRSSPLWLKLSAAAAAALVLVVGVALALRDGESPQQAAAVGNTTTTVGTTTTPSTTTTAPPPSAAPALTPPTVVRTTTTTSPTTTTTVPPTTEPPTTAPPTTEPPPEYRNCWEALRAGALPLERGEPGYGPHLDDDGDGRACEWGEGNGRGTR
jgi:Excalibur calcium-binding domain